jgi:hypothetical protein
VIFTGSPRCFTHRVRVYESAHPDIPAARVGRIYRKGHDAEVDQRVGVELGDDRGQAVDLPSRASQRIAAGQPELELELALEAPELSGPLPDHLFEDGALAGRP